MFYTSIGDALDKPLLESNGPHGFDTTLENFTYVWEDSGKSLRCPNFISLLTENKKRNENREVGVGMFFNI